MNGEKKNRRKFPLIQNMNLKEKKKKQQKRTDYIWRDHDDLVTWGAVDFRCELCVATNELSPKLDNFCFVCFLLRLSRRRSNDRVIKSDFFFSFVCCTHYLRLRLNMNVLVCEPRCEIDLFYFYYRVPLLYIFINKLRE